MGVTLRFFVPEIAPEVAVIVISPPPLQATPVAIPPLAIVATPLLLEVQVVVFVKSDVVASL